MKDSICLIDPEHFINDKSYSNVVELALRESFVINYLRLSGANGGKDSFSDFDLLSDLIGCFVKNSDTSSRAYRFFSSVLKKFDIDATDVIAGRINAEEIWHKTSGVMFKRENMLSGIIARSGLESIGVAQLPWKYKRLPESIGNTEIVSVACPLGVLGENLVDNGGFAELTALRKSLGEWSELGDFAVLMSELDFEFCEPNLYLSSRAFDKYIQGQPIKNSERDILKTQLLRDLIFAASEKGHCVNLVLPEAQNLKMMYQTEQLLEYIDECITAPVSITLFASDVVAYSFAASCEAKRYKKITVEAAVCGVDRYLIADDVKYWGKGHVPEKTASLSKTPAHLGEIICQSPFLASDHA